MKFKIISFFIIFLLIISFSVVGCSESNPENTVSLYSEYIKNLQYDKIYDILSKDSIGERTKKQYIESFGMDTNEDKNAQIMAKSLLKYFDFKPIDSQIKGNEAIVKTEVTMPNISKIFSDLLPELFALALTNENIGEAANALMIDYLKENTLETIKVNKDIRLVQEDGWKIDINSFELFDFPDLDSIGDTSPVEESVTTEVSDIEITTEEITTEEITTEIEYLQLGETVSIPNWDYKVEEVKTLESIGEYNARGIFVVVLIEVTNTSNSEKEVGSELFQAMDEQGRIYNMNGDGSLEYYQEYDMNLWFLDALGPSLTDVLPIVFDVPKDAANIALITENDKSNAIILLETINS